MIPLNQNNDTINQIVILHRWYGIIFLSQAKGTTAINRMLLFIRFNNTINQYMIPLKWK